RNFGEHIPGVDRLSLLHENVRSHGEQIPCDRVLAVLFLDGHAWTQRRAAMLDYDLARKAGDLVKLFLHRDAFDNVTIGYPAAGIRQNRQRIRVPLDELLAHLYPFAVLELDLGPVHNRILFPLTSGFVIDGDLRIPAHHDPLAFLVADRDSRVMNVRIPLRIEAHKPQRSGMLWVKDGLLHDLARSSSDVKGAHGELRSRLAD